MLFSNRNEPFSVTAHAHAKAILTGEHAVIYGAKAVAVPLSSLVLNVTISGGSSSSKERPISFKFHTQDTIPTASHFLPQEDLESLLTNVLIDALKLEDIDYNSLFPLVIDINTNIPIGAGLGSSAALSVAFVRACKQLANKSLKTEDVASHAMLLERHFHGNPSGLDTTVITNEAPLLFEKGAAPMPLPLSMITDISPKRVDSNSKALWHFVLIDSNTRASTKTMIECTKSKLTGPEGAHFRSRCNDLSELAVKALTCGDQTSLGKVLNDSKTFLEDLNVVTDVLRDLCDFLNHLKVLGSKPTGAGGGGFVLSLLDPANFRSCLEELKTEFGANRIFPFYLDGPLTVGRNIFAAIKSEE